MASCTICVLFLLLTKVAISQEYKPREKYLLGTDQRLQIRVHIWGEVNKPGDYLVPDGTTVLELISAAGGPTEYANLTHVKLTKETNGFFVSEKALLDIVEEANQNRISKEALNKSLKERFSQRILDVDLTQYLNAADRVTPIPTLEPGDVVQVKKNIWHKWRTVVRIASEVAVIASVYVWYLRAEKWD